MALRIHFPWGWLFTVVGFAALGAASGYLLLHDFHGHLYRQCLALGFAGAILGACGWLMSERVAYAGNLNTSPFLRLLLSGVAASAIGTWVCAPFLELVVGEGPWWPEIAGGGLYLASAVLPLVGGLTVVAGLEMLIVAQRGGTGMLSAFRPIAPYFFVGVLLLSLVVASGIYLRSEIRDLVLRAAPDRSRSSGWTERERGLFAQVLAGQGCDVLVAPVLVPPGQPSLDRPARSLIGRYLAQEIATQTGLCVVDPTLVSRALGATSRPFDPEDAVALAAAANARWLIRANVELDAVDRSFILRVYPSARGNGPTPAWVAGEIATLGPIAFSDQLPPEAAFEPHVRALAQQLALGGEKPAEAPRIPPAQAALPDSLERLADDPGSDGERTRRLQLLAMLYAPGDDASAQLWERSLVALGDLARDDEQARVLRARAALHLHRRPYAVALLQQLNSAEARALLAIVQANLIEAEQAAASVRDRATALMTQLEIEAMRVAFGRNTGANERRQALLGAYPSYAPLIEAAWSAGGTQTVVQNGLAQALNRLGASVSDDPQDLVRRWSRVAILETAVGDDLAQRSAAIERGYAPLWLSRRAQWRLRPAADRPAEWDVFDALYAANRAALAREAADLRAPGGRPEAVLTLADTSTPLFGGFPPLAATVAASLHDLRGRRAAPDELTLERERRLLRDLLEWEGGDDQVTRAIAALAAPPPYARDEPPRAWRLAQLAGAAGRKPVPKPMASAAELMRAVDYTRYDFSLVEQAYAAMRGSEAAEQMVSHNQQRFLGHPDRDRFMTQRAEERGDAAATVALLEQQLRERPQDWETRARLAKVYLAAREMEAAQRTLLAYPAFAASDGVSTESAEKAWHAGEWLLWAGEPRLAQTVFAIGARDASGSVGAGWCGLRLNQIAGNWRQARDWARNLHEGSAAPGALIAAAQMSFLLNEPDEGWRAFYEAAKRFEDIGPWSAALLGHRIARTADREVLDFTTRWKSLSGEARAEAPIKDAFAFQALMIDRAPAPKVAESLGTFAARNGDEVHQQLGAAYEAFRRGQFPAAADRFSALLSEAKSDVSYAVPYLTASLIKADRGPEAEALLEDLRAKGKRGVPALLASAYARGLAGDPGRAVDALWRAQLELVDAPPAAVPPSFQVLETCEKLFELTHDDRYRQWLLYLARRQQSAWPTSWSYAFEAKHSSDASARAQAFAMAAYLDAGSAHLAGSNEAQRKKAAEMVAKSYPFGK